MTDRRKQSGWSSGRVRHAAALIPPTGIQGKKRAGARSLGGLSGRRPGDPQTGPAPRSGRMEDSLLTPQAGGRTTASGGLCCPAAALGRGGSWRQPEASRRERDAGPTHSVPAPLRTEALEGGPATGGDTGDRKRQREGGPVGGKDTGCGSGAQGDGKCRMAAGLLGGPPRQ